MQIVAGCRTLNLVLIQVAWETTKSTSRISAGASIDVASLF